MGFCKHGPREMFRVYGLPENNHYEARVGIYHIGVFEGGISMEHTTVCRKRDRLATLDVFIFSLRFPPGAYFNCKVGKRTGGGVFFFSISTRRAL